ncbi:AsmA-like protein [Chitinophaga dinghuensis]|uniref:AsmA-like protein n=1 Tax=Chitinophaga dinghuensis TaxID=1539050 RepID=A0A327VWH7_9BACT|nr:AsmA-like C-terminal region-containing protein [Chitinophaga dinghuensis]RAJ79315.1 AsmA-like protein [Chitinophaga dinghuensis]
MRKWLRLTLFIAGGILGVLILLFLGLALYIRANKADFLKQITEQIDGRISGKLTIGDMEPSLVRNFPNISLNLSKVQLQDSLFASHHRYLLDIQHIYVKLNTWSLLKKRVKIKEVILENGGICLYTDSTGYTNTSVFQHKSTSSPSKQADIGELRMENVTFVIENKQKQKYFDLLVKEMSGSMMNQGDSVAITLHTKIRSRHFEFNTVKGSYLKDKEMDLPLKLSFNRKTKVLHIPGQKISIDGKPVTLGGNFVFDEKPPAFSLQIIANELLLKEGASWLPPGISGKLSTLGLQKPLDVTANIDGYMKYRDTPHVIVSWKTTDNVLQSSLGAWSSCSFTGRFNNQVLDIPDHTDANSAVSIFNLAATLGTVPVKADTIRVVNLKQPLLRGHFQSSFPLANLNDNSNSLPLHFNAGQAVADLNYTGPIMKDDTSASSLMGVVQVNGAGFTYAPRSLQFKDCNATLRFTGQDLLLENVKVQSANSTLFMNGKMKNVLNFYFTAPDKILLEWNIRSPLVDLNEFRSYLSPRQGKKPSAAARKAHIGRVGNQLESVLEACNVNMQVQLDKTVYKHFTAQQVKATLLLTADDILLNRISLQHAGGTLGLQGKIHQQGINNYFDIAASLTNVNISQLFYAFDNFGIDGLTYKNLQGIATVKTNMKGNVLDNGTLAKRSLNGTIQLNMKKGALLDFSPLGDIGNFLFRKRRLDSITFANLNNTFRVENGKVYIPPMRVASSAVNIDLQGVYGIGGGTNIQMEVPLRNPNKDTSVTDPTERFKRSRKGIILRLRAIDGPDGKVKIKMGKGDESK